MPVEPMPSAPRYVCKDCGTGTEITGEVFRVQRRKKTFDEAGRLTAVDRAGEFDFYCREHYERRKASNTL